MNERLNRRLYMERQLHIKYKLNIAILEALKNKRNTVVYGATSHCAEDMLHKRRTNHWKVRWISYPPKVSVNNSPERIKEL